MAGWMSPGLRMERGVVGVICVWVDVGVLRLGSLVGSDVGVGVDLGMVATAVDVDDGVRAAEAGGVGRAIG